jgi:hypothetical protein
MVRLFGRAFAGKGARVLSQARAAELRGELAQAAVLFAQAGRLDETSRVMVLRGDAEVDPAARLRHYVQAVTTAPEGCAAHAHARRKRALAVLAMAADLPLTTTLREELALAGRELEALGEPERASEAYSRIGDVESEARALARTGDVDKLDAVLAAAQVREREALTLRRARDEIVMLVATGRRREATALAAASGDAAVQAHGQAILSRRAGEGLLRVAVRGREMNLALGREVVVGRARPEREAAHEVTLAVGAAAVSRRHLGIARRGERVLVRDLGSRNGTTLRGLELGAEVPAEEALELRLGKEVVLRVAPAPEIPGAMSIEVAGVRYIAPLGPATLGVGGWKLDRAQDGWIELTTGGMPPAFAGSLQLAAEITLLCGDSIAGERGGPPLVEVLDNGR